jgi:hypothetical protein
MQLSTDPPPRTLAAKAAAARWAARSAEIDPHDEDTIELELTPHQLRELEESARRAFARKRENALAATPRLTVISAPQVSAPQPMAAPIVVAPPVIEATAIASNAEAARSSPRRAGRGLLAVAITISVLVIGAAVIRLSTSRPALETQPEPVNFIPPQTATQTAPPPPPVVDVVAPVAPSEPVRFANPFDRSETFEFPPGTTRDEARDAVAQMLIERARERRHR